MSRTLPITLRNVDSGLLAAWLSTHNIPHDEVPVDKAERKKFAGDLYLSLIDNATHYAGMAKDAERIDDLKSSNFDWLFADVIPDDINPVYFEYSDRDRVLWLLLNQAELLEAIERRASYAHYTSTKKRHSQFLTEPDVIVEPSDAQIGDFETDVKAIFGAHDGSGTYSVTEQDMMPKLGGASLNMITVSLSRLPDSIEHFSEDGSLETESMRRVTDTHVAYELSTGTLYVAASRGGYPVHQSIAEAYASKILQVDTTPTVRKAERLNFEAFKKVDDLPLLADVNMESVELVEVELRNPTLGTTAVSVRNTDGLPEDALKKIFGAKANLTNILSVKVRLHFAADTEDGSTPRPRVVTFSADGSTSLREDVEIDKTLSERLPVLWRMKDRER